MAFPTLLLWILASVTIVSLISFVGVLTLFFQKRLETALNYLVSFAAGAMLAAAFFDLLPEALEKNPGNVVFLLVLIGMITFFTIELFLHWHHHHTHKGDEPTHIHPVGYLNLVGDGVHNFIDGMIIAASFLISVPLGLVTTLAVVLHEIPQEFGDFGILVYSGFAKGKALFFNFLTALTAVAGALFAYFSSSYISSFGLLLIPFAAGSFIYIATADLLPEIHKHGSGKAGESMLKLIVLLLGVFLIAVIGTLFKA